VKNLTKILFGEKLGHAKILSEKLQQLRVRVIVIKYTPHWYLNHYNLQPNFRYLKLGLSRRPLTIGKDWHLLKTLGMNLQILLYHF